MTEVWFYHLQRRSVEAVLPGLVERSLARGWTAVVQAADAAAIARIDAALWSASPTSFIPHGGPDDGDVAQQPAYLTTGEERPNGAAVRFLLDRAQAASVLAQHAAPPYERLILLFDGNDADALADARAQWKTLKDAGHALAYWRQDDTGRWEKKA